MIGTYYTENKLIRNEKKYFNLYNLSIHGDFLFFTAYWQ